VQKEQTVRLIERLRTYCDQSGATQTSLAAMFGVSPANLSEIMRGKNTPNGETALRMLKFLDSTNMKSETIGLPKLRENPDEPLDFLNGKPATLTAAREMIDGLRSQLKAGGPKAATGPTPNPPPAQAPPIDPASDPGFKKMEQTKAPPAKLLPASADTPVLIQRILDVTNLDDLLSMLGNRAHSSLQTSCIYSEVKSRRALLAGRQ
jgi:transcriptional regulator with XRE-family HTH domain